MKFRACIESNMYYEYSLWNLYLIYKQQDNNEAQMEILFILIQVLLLIFFIFFFIFFYFLF